MMRNSTKAASAAFFLVLAVSLSGAAAQVPCWPREALAADLAARWGETPVGRGIASAGLLIELFATPDGSGWTLVATGPDGRACPLVAGRDWHPPSPSHRRAPPDGERGS